MTDTLRAVPDTIPFADESRNIVSSTNRLIVFARYPESGKVKTRLIPALGADQAAHLHFALAQMTLSAARRLGTELDVDLELRVTGTDDRSFGAQLGDDFVVRPQAGRDLGERLKAAACAAFSDGVQKLVVVGTDCPELNSAILQQAFAALEKADLVLGPALDGGYYLIAMRKLMPTLFQGIDWGSDRVLEQTRLKAKQHGLRVFQLPALSDVDHPEDLIVCRNQKTGFENVFPEPQMGLLSIIVPTRNEERTLGETLSALADLPNLEVIVADGESSDGTIEIARQFAKRCAAKVVPVRKGRGRQMNAGAALSRGEVLLFLHADSKLPENFVERVWKILAEGAIAGSFKLGISGAQAGLRLVESGANFRSRFFQMPYGDQGLFLRSETFFRLGGYRHWPLMEDYEFCQRLRKHGEIVIAPESVTTSDRRWRELGIARTTLFNQLYITAFRLGVSPERLAKWYDAANAKKARLPIP